MNGHGYRLNSMRTGARYVAATMTEPEIVVVTVPNVELLEVGDNWETSTGTFSWTMEDLQAAVAAQDDPGIRTPVVKLGHKDARFDGQPALGRIENLRLSNNDQTLVGDLVGIPRWLAECMASAFPRRSIEGFFDFTTRTGNTWAFALTGVALLGDAYPAIDTLEDIAALYGAEPPVLVPADQNEQIVAAERGNMRVAVRVEAAPPQDPTPPSRTEPRYIEASVSYGDVSTAFYDTGPGGEPGNYWWWIRDVLASPNELIVDDDEGHLFRVSYTIDTNGNGPDAVTFGDPQEVRVEYVDVAASRSLVRYGNPVAAGRPRTRRAVSAGAPQTEVHDVQLTDDQIRALGLEPGATDEEISAALSERLAAAPPPVTEPPVAGPAPTTDPTPPAAEVPDGMVLVDSATLDDLRDGVAAARRIEQQNVEAERGRILDAAVLAGKFAPARREHYEQMLVTDPEGGREAIAKLADNLIPVQERGVTGGDVDQVEGPAYPDSWKPTVAAAQRKSSSSRVKVVAD
jgi:hypothetical protein